ncbi:MAG: dihydroorotate dehydrogenase electron transfer subunit [Deltaproteobacteria bacterium]|nr:dihydroorotate dehydrogenase electron transfer subunit [Deltaproteobacteria bacterium]
MIHTFPPKPRYFPSAKILLNEEVSLGYSMMMAAVPKDFTFAPGQFLMVRVNHQLSPFLGRPMAIMSVEDGKLIFCYRVVGKGTGVLAQMRKNDVLQMWGPLGIPFSLPENGPVALLAGGVGMPPLYSAAETLFKIRKSAKGIYFFYGGRTSADVFFVDKLERFCEKVFVTAEDGSIGVRGLVTLPFSEFLKDRQRDSLHVAGCGPYPMMKSIAEICSQKGIPCEVSLEERMACGVGVCLGCTALCASSQGEKSWIRLCVEGPVIDSSRVIWNRSR